MKAIVLSSVSDNLVFNLSFPRAHTTTTIRQEKWIRVFQLFFSTLSPSKPISLLFAFQHSPLLMRLFNWIVFPVSRQLLEKAERGSKSVLTSHFLAQCFSSNSSL